MSSVCFCEVKNCVSSSTHTKSSLGLVCYCGESIDKLGRDEHLDNMASSDLMLECNATFDSCQIYHRGFHSSNAVSRGFSLTFVSVSVYC